MNDEDDWDPALGLMGELPPLPPELPPDQGVVVARWTGPAFAAVRSWLRFEEEGEDLFDDDVTLFARVGDTCVEADGSGGTGGDYSARLLRPPDVGPRFAGLSSQHSHSGEGWICSAVSGVAGTEGRWVEVHDSRGVTRLRIESQLGYFVACSDGSRAFEVRVTDEAGAALLAETVRPS